MHSLLPRTAQNRPKRLIIATRGSPLALWQAGFVAELIKAAQPGIVIDTLVLKTKGDRITSVPLAKIGGKGVFVKEIEEALLDGRADLAVHSMKDMPMQLPDGLAIGATPERGPVEDVLLLQRYPNLKALPPGAIIGTSSMRRQAQILALRPDLQTLPLRGNIATRLDKLRRGEFDAIILAQAGLTRLGVSARFAVSLDPHRFVPAAGQGALGLEYRKNRDDLAHLLAGLNHPPTACCLEAERAFVSRLGAGCHAPVGAFAWFEGGELHLRGMLAGATGAPLVNLVASGNASTAGELGCALAEKIEAEARGLSLPCPG